MELKGSKTEKNLMTAFAGESQACVKYQYYASQAKKDGYVKIQNIFAETSNNEKNMQNYGSRLCMAEKFQQQQKT